MIILPNLLEEGKTFVEGLNPLIGYNYVERNTENNMIRLACALFIFCVSFLVYRYYHSILNLKATFDFLFESALEWGYNKLSQNVIFLNLNPYIVVNIIINIKLIIYNLNRIQLQHKIFKINISMKI